MKTLTLASSRCQTYYFLQLNNTWSATVCPFSKIAINCYITPPFSWCRFVPTIYFFLLEAVKKGRQPLLTLFIYLCQSARNQRKTTAKILQQRPFINLYVFRLRFLHSVANRWANVTKLVACLCCVWFPPCRPSLWGRRPVWPPPCRSSSSSSSPPGRSPPAAGGSPSNLKQGRRQDLWNMLKMMSLFFLNITENLKFKFFKCELYPESRLWIHNPLLKVAVSQDFWQIFFMNWTNLGD